MGRYSSEYCETIYLLFEAGNKYAPDHPSFQPAPIQSTTQKVIHAGGQQGPSAETQGYTGARVPPVFTPAPLPQAHSSFTHNCGPAAPSLVTFAFPPGEGEGL